MRVSGYSTPKPEAFRDFVEGVDSLQAYLRSNDEEKLTAAKKRLSDSLSHDPDFAAAQYYKAIVLTHLREPTAAIDLLEGLKKKGERYKAEILYNLAFAYARTYKYERFKEAIKSLEDAQRFAKREGRDELILLVTVMQAWVFAVFAGRSYDHPEDFTERKTKLLPKAANIAEAVLKDSRLEKLPSEAQTTVEVEAHNAAGIAYMRMGQNGDLFKGPEKLWRIAEQHYKGALAKHPRDVRVLDNISTLNLIQGTYALTDKRETNAREHFVAARDSADESISYNRKDRFRHYNRAQALALLDHWDAASDAADDVLRYPGAVTDEQVKKLKEAILGHNKAYILQLHIPAKKR